nr:restriction endonuclease subunit S [Marichromatium bheemlicum]
MVAGSNDLLHANADWWERVPLGNACEILNGFPFKSKHFNGSDGAPVIRIRDVTSGVCTTFYSGEIPEGYWVEPSDIVVGMDGDFNCRLWPSERGLLNQRVCKLNPHKDFLDKRFVSYALPAYLRLINDHTHSITVKHLSSKTIAEIPFPLPPLPEQRRIVAKLDSLFERTRRAREELSQIPRLIEHYKKAILEAAFRGDLTKDWRSQELDCNIASPRPSSEIKKKYRSGNGASFSPPYSVPANWCWLRLPEFGDLDRGKSKHRPRNDPALYGGDYPFIQTGEVREADGILTEFAKTYNESGLAQSRLWPVGTVCITIAANIAETAILGIEACFPDSVVGFIPDQETALESYIEFFLRTMKEDLDAFAPATAQKNINLDTLSNVYVPVPPLVEQVEIVARIEKVMDWLAVVHEEVEQATHLLDHLDQANLAKAFRGELVPQDPNDEPASVLLERIRAARDAQPKPIRRRRARSTTAVERD